MRVAIFILFPILAANVMTQPGMAATQNTGS